ncbi:hypothetical protein [Psychroserpens burtonensis]|uniref:hypothetical protein n=1 Tax=Psychroserpens burtonensis TaxID=49278 RepID=UPI00164CCDDB|nr:hypothetical protein [Psychroserpens burtonensis]
MRNFTVILLFLSTFCFAKSDKNPIRNTASTLKEVTVYLSGAQIERIATINAVEIH